MSPLRCAIEAPLQRLPPKNELRHQPTALVPHVPVVPVDGEEELLPCVKADKTLGMGLTLLHQHPSQGQVAGTSHLTCETSSRWARVNWEERGVVV